MANEHIGEPLTGAELEGGAGTWTVFVPDDSYIAQAMRDAETRQIERAEKRERIMASRGLRFIHWLFQTSLWKEHKAAR